MHGFEVADRNVNPRTTVARPASNNNTRRAGLRSTDSPTPQPADPAPMMMKSKVVAGHGGGINLDSVRERYGRLIAS